MHIAVLTGSYHGLSGVCSHVQGLTCHLGKAGPRVTVFAPDVQQEDSTGNVHFARIHDIPFIPQILFYFTELLRQHQKAKIDIVHIHDSIAFFAAYLFSRTCRVPTVFTFHASVFNRGQVADYSWLTIQVYRFTNRFVARHADRIICVNQEMVRCAQYAGASEDRIVSIPNLLDLSIFHPTAARNQSPVCLCVGALRPAKGVRYLIQALPDVLKSVPDLTLLIVGDGPERQVLQVITRELGLDGVVRFVGYVKREDVVPYYQQSRLFVTPSLREAQPFVVLEAMACGLPVVASAVGGIPEIVRDNVNGLLVDPGDSLSLAQAIVRLLNDDTLYIECSANALDTIQAFSWQQNIDKFITLFQSTSIRC